MQPGNRVVSEGVSSVCWTACGSVSGKHTESLFNLNEISSVFGSIIHHTQALHKVMSYIWF